MSADSLVAILGKVEVNRQVRMIVRNELEAKAESDCFSPLLR